MAPVSVPESPGRDSGVPTSCYWANTLLKPSAAALLSVSMAQHGTFAGVQV